MLEIHNLSKTYSDDTRARSQGQLRPPWTFASVLYFALLCSPLWLVVLACLPGILLVSQGQRRVAAVSTRATP